MGTSTASRAAGAGRWRAFGPTARLAATSGLASAALAVAATLLVVPTPRPDPPTGHAPAEPVAGRIVTPVENEEVGLCTPVRGFAAPLSGDAPYWLLFQAVDGGDATYLVTQLAVDGDRAPVWDAGLVRIGRPDQVGQRFDLILVRVGDPWTAQNWLDHLAADAPYAHVPETVTVVDRVRVRRAVTDIGVADAAGADTAGADAADERDQPTIDPYSYLC